MQLSAPLGALPPAVDIPSALRVAATRLGHRPAVTTLRPDRRDEQGFASLAQWAAKGAHLLTLEVQLQPGDLVQVAMPAGWPAAAVCLAAWWVGAIVTAGDGRGNRVDGRGNRVDGRGNRVEVAVFHESWPAPVGVSDTYSVGDAMDGTPLTAVDAEAWAHAVQAFPDQPPSSRAEPHSIAVELDDETSWTQAELLGEARRWGFEGALGVTSTTPPEVWLPALVRPLLVGRPTVVLAGVAREAADAEGVGIWA